MLVGYIVALADVEFTVVDFAPYGSSWPLLGPSQLAWYPCSIQNCPVVWPILLPHLWLSVMHYGFVHSQQQTFLTLVDVFLPYVLSK